MVKPNREALREYIAGSLWVLPGATALAALGVGAVVSSIDVGPNSPLAPLAFQGTADDARTLLIAVSGTVVTVIALVLGLTVVALQLSSTQFSPRLLRNFLRDRPNQLVLSVFVATFMYSAAGLYTVGLSAGARIEDYPRLAVSGSLLLLFASLAMVVYFADHLAHSLQIDTIMRKVERQTLAAVPGRLGDTARPTHPPPWAVPLRSHRSGYIQTVHPEWLLPLATTHAVFLRLRFRVGEHTVAGTVLGWVWRQEPNETPPDAQVFERALEGAVRVGFERTFEQDAAFGLRQLCDITCKALSAAINDPYTAIQGIDHLAVVFCALSRRPLGDDVSSGPGGQGTVIIPGQRYGEYLAVMCGLVRRYGVKEPTVVVALLRLLTSCAMVLDAGSDRRAALAEEAELILADAAGQIHQSADFEQVRQAAQILSGTLGTELRG